MKKPAHILPGIGLDRQEGEERWGIGSIVLVMIGVGGGVGAAYKIAKRLPDRNKKIMYNVAHMKESLSTYPSFKEGFRERIFDSGKGLEVWFQCGHRCHSSGYLSQPE
ncbi:MAG: hypothetical protein ACE5JO_06425 [Candidatus Binatia bacterium]